jgi:hypothetical protein
MGINPQQEHIHVVTPKEKRDRADGHERGYYSPYPKEKEKIILANIEKVSPAFVEGYWHGKWLSWSHDTDPEIGGSEWYQYTGERPTNRFI